MAVFMCTEHVCQLGVSSHIQILPSNHYELLYRGLNRLAALQYSHYFRASGPEMLAGCALLRACGNLTRPESVFTSPQKAARDKAAILREAKRLLGKNWTLVRALDLCWTFVTN
jgi:hypothetical protein